MIHESLPGIYVTGNLYKPNQPGGYPAVLMPAGHTQEAKPEPRITAANLAMKRLVAFAYDPIGQRERKQTYPPQLSRVRGACRLVKALRAILSSMRNERWTIWSRGPRWTPIVSEWQGAPAAEPSRRE